VAHLQRQKARALAAHLELQHVALLEQRARLDGARLAAAPVGDLDAGRLRARGAGGARVRARRRDLEARAPHDERQRDDQRRDREEHDQPPGTSARGWGRIVCHEAGALYAFSPIPVRPSGSTRSTLTCGRGMMCTATSSPTRSAARWPASVAAFTAAT